MKVQDAKWGKIQMVRILSVFLAILAAPVVLQATCRELARPVVPELGLSYRRIVQQNPVFPESEHQALLEQFAETADLSLRNKLVVHNLSLIFSLVRRHIGPYREHFFDLVHEGVMGLIEAIEAYDPFSIQNTSFGSFATTVIRRHIFRYLREKVRVVRVKRRYDQQKKFESLKKNLERQNLNAQERREELAQKMQVSPQMIDLMDAGYSEVTLDSIAHLLKGDEAPFMVKDPIFIKGLQRFLQTLSPRERDIFKKRFLSFNPPSQRQLAKEYETLQESIYGTEKNLIEKLKKFMADFIPPSQTPQESDPFAGLPRVQREARKKLARFVPAFAHRLPREEQIGPFLQTLPERERDILRQRFLSSNPSSLRSFAKRYDLALTVAHRMENRVLNALSKYVVEHPM